MNQLGEMSSQISHAQRLALITLAVAAATFGIGIFMIQIPWQESRRQLTGAYQENTERGSLLASLQQQISSQKKQEKELLLEGGTPVLTSEVTQLASEAGLEIESLVPRDETNLPPYTKLQIEVSGSALPAHLLSFLQKMEQHRPLLVLNELEIGNRLKPGSSAAFGTSKKPAPEFSPNDTREIRFLISAYSRPQGSR